MSKTKTLVLDSIPLQVTYVVTEAIVENVGHPDNALPNTPKTVEVLEVSLILTDSLVSDIEDILLGD